jgi:hypothetical protein
MSVQQPQPGGAPLALAVMSLSALVVLVSFLLPEPVRETIIIDCIIVGFTAPVLALINDLLIPLIFKAQTK